MDNEPILKELISRKSVLKGQLTRFCTFCDILEHDQSNVNQLPSRLLTAETLINDFISVHIQLLTLDEPKHNEYEKEFAEFEDKFHSVLAKATALNKELNVDHQSVPSQVHNSCQINQQSCSVKLPAIDLPTFNGNPEKWLQFCDTFTSLIHEDTNLNKVQKLYYLKSCLKDSAEAVIASLEVTNDNYDIAWSILNDRFKNEKMIIHSHVRALFELPVIQKEAFSQLRKMVDEINKNLRVLETFNQPVSEWSTLLIYLLCSKLDHNTKRQWESENINNKKLPTLDHFLHFLAQRSLLLETLYANKDNSQTPYNKSQKPRSQSFFNQTNQDFKCYFCKGPHSLFYCSKFLSLPIKIRNQEVQKLKLCANCLRSNHTIDKCTSSGCKICGKPHNSLLHYYNTNQSRHQSSYHLNTGSNQSQQPNIRQSNQHQNSSLSITTHSQSNQTSDHKDSLSENQSNNQSSQSVPVVLNCMQTQHREVLLATAIVNIFDNSGNIHQARVLLDSGSQSNFITTELCVKLNLPKQSFSLPVSGISEIVTKINHRVNATIKSRVNSYQINSSFLVLDKITENLPIVKVNVNELVMPNNIALADDNFYLPGKIDLLLGASVFYDLLCIGQIRINSDFPIIQKTKLGWVITGNIPYASKRQTHTMCNLEIDSIQDQLQKFWELENVENKRAYSKEQEECETEFMESVRRNKKGRFIVPLLTKNNITDLGDSFQTALNRFKYLERKLEKNSELKELYIDFMKEYQNLGHMIPVGQEENEDNSCYLPHHGVLKINNTTTKLRVVFDGSVKTTSNLSLNDCLKIGPTIQPDLFTILLRFRSFNVVLASDVEKMYRQVIVKQEHQNLQKILWRSNSSEEIQQFKLTRVTYGTASAPFLAIRCLNEVANQNQNDFPEASKAIKEGFYVDDLLYGTDNIETARQLKNDLQYILEKTGFVLRKWFSNQPNIFTNELQNQLDIEHFISNKEENKTLGVHWHSTQDMLFYDVKVLKHDIRVTKRNVLSIIAQIFDPLGLVGPCIIQAKIILQRIWKLNLDWDESLPNDLHTRFVKFTNQLPELNKINIPRHAVLPNATSIQLHGFCDASEVAYGACVYIYSSQDNTQQVQLLCAKGRIAPLKALTIPKLELCAATVLADIMEKVKKSLNISFDKVSYWTDSTIVLCWLNGKPYQWKPFVSNRVAHIQSLTKLNEWGHVISKENPADQISRGLNPEELYTSKLWWNGPWWLSSKEDKWPKVKSLTSKEIPEQKTQSSIIVLSSIEQDFDILRKYSSVNKLQHVVAYILRFKHNSLNKITKLYGPLSVVELTASLNAIIKLVQNEMLKNDIVFITKNKSVNITSKLVSLNPVLEDGILRVGGRIKHSPLLDFSQKHPIILPASHPFTECLIRHEHYKHLHAGPQSLLAILRTQYWILSGLTTVKRILRKCIVCFRNKPRSINQLMGDLPKNRITPSRAFLNTGLDYCGPFNVKANKLRNSKFIKVYVCIFVCFSTKATHLEVVSDLTSECFLNCLKRFISRRGKPLTLYSDNATTFVGANNTIKEIHFVATESNIPIQNYLSSERIDWKFIPARSPHFGGIWEAAVKSFKFHLKRIIGNHIFSLENFATLTIQIEACLNSRPLTPLSSDPSDFQALTPGHFLIFSPLTSFPEPDMRQEQINRLNVYQHMAQILQHFWTRWSTEYISQLQTRTKWKTDNQFIIKEGQLVCCKDDNLPPLHWKLGRISKVFPGSDGRIRVVLVKTDSGEIKRAVSKVCVLPIDTE